MGQFGVFHGFVLGSKISFVLYILLGITNAVFLSLTNMEDGPDQIYNYVMAGSILSFIFLVVTFLEICMCMKGILGSGHKNELVRIVGVLKVLRGMAMIIMLGFGGSIYNNMQNDGTINDAYNNSDENRGLLVMAIITFWMQLTQFVIETLFLIGGSCII